jgi:cyclase
LTFQSTTRFSIFNLQLSIVNLQLVSVGGLDAIMETIAMDYRRIIPCLDVKDGRLVKGINFVKLKDVGDPAENAAVYSQAGADELVFLDITATIEKRKTLLDAVRRTVEKISVPLTVGGGIGNCKAIRELLQIGASRVSINTAAVRNPNFVKEASKEFGSDKIVVAIDTSTNSQLPSGFEVIVTGGTVGTGLDAVEWAKKVQELGAGAILPTSMDTDGTEAGYDIPMTRAIADAVSLPVIASGGAGTLEHLYQAIVDGHADAVLVASIAHFGKYTIRQMKEYLAKRQIPVNL